MNKEGILAGLLVWFILIGILPVSSPVQANAAVKGSNLFGAQYVGKDMVDGTSDLVIENPAALFLEYETGMSGSGLIQLQNVALGKPASQSSTAFGAEASRAVDGNTNGQWGSRSVTHTILNQTDPWWEVDLGAAYDISEIKIFKRTDCCTQLLDNYRITYSDQPITANSPEYVGYQRGSTVTPVSYKKSVNKVRYVRISVKGNTPFYLAEVQVFGVPAGSAAPTSQPSGNAVNATSVEYLIGSVNKLEFVKIADKTWRQGPVAAQITWRETDRDSTSIYLSRIDPNSGQEQKVTLDLQRKEVLIYSNPGFGPTVFPITNIVSGPSTGSSATAGCSISDWAGEWNTNFNLLTWTAQPDGSLSGNYNTQKHSIIARPVTGNPCTVEGTYSLTDGISKGRIRFMMDPDKRSFKGAWSPANQDPTGTNWTGTKKTPAVAAATPRPPADTSSGGGVIRGDVYITSCSAGKAWGKTTVAGERCFPKVEFYGKNNVSLGDAQTLAVSNGWVLANSQEVETAWNQLELDSYAYGMLDDGRFAIPVQKDHPPTIKRGPNIDASGGNQGFYYVRKEAVSRMQLAPPPPSKSNELIVGNPGGLTSYPNAGQIPDSILTNPAFAHLRFKMICNSDPGNPMLDGWNNADRPLLEAAARELFKKEGKIGWRDNINELLPQLRTDPERRWKFAPFMVQAYWDALVVKNPNGAQAQFKAKFENWAACDETKVARLTLAQWNNFTGKSNSLDGEFWFGEMKPYTQNGLFIPRKRSTEGFLPLENPMFFGFRGRDAIQKLIGPMLAHQTPDEEDYENLRALDDEMALLAEKIGFGSAGALAFVGLAGTPIVVDAVKRAAFTIDVGAEIRVRDVNNAKDALTDAVGLKTGGNKVPAKAVKAVANAKDAAKVAKAANAARRAEIAKELAKHLWRTAGSKAAKAGAEAGAEAGAKLAIQVSSKVAFRFALSVAVVGALLTIGDIAGAIAEAIKAEKYEQALKRSASTVKPFSVSKELGSDPDGVAKATLFMQLLKMSIADPVDQGLLSIEYPTIECPPGMKNGTRTICVWEVKFHDQPSLSMAQVQEIANNNGWQIATPEEVEEAWYYLDYERYGFGRMSNGGFAVPVHNDFPNFKFGPNLNVTGGNQGFFYTTGKAKLSVRARPATDEPLRNLPRAQPATSPACTLSDWVGTWNTNFSPINWTAQPDGSLVGFYRTATQKIQAKPLSNNPCVVEGTWWDSNPNGQKGRIRFTMNPDKRSFKGTWSYGDADPTGNTWDGTRN